MEGFVASYAGYSTLAGSGVSSLAAAGMTPQRVMGHNQWGTRGESPEFAYCNDISCNSPVRNPFSGTVTIFIVWSVDDVACGSCKYFSWHCIEYVRSKPTGKYARRLWFLYEFLTGKTLPLDNVKRGNYIDLLDPDKYYTVTPARQVRRQRINDNLPGDYRFCPMVRRTDTLRDFEAADIPRRCQQVVSAYSPELLKRALGYLYTRETKSSFEIEHIKSTSSRTERFVALLQLAESKDFCEKTKLIDLQNRIVDPRFSESDYRLSQNYVGETIAWQKEKIHFVCPKPEVLTDLMKGLVAAHGRMEQAVQSAYGSNPPNSVKARVENAQQLYCSSRTWRYDFSRGSSIILPKGI